MRQFNHAITLCGIAACLFIGANGQQQMKNELLSRIDHLVYATPDLEAGITQVERLLGVKAIPGGQHPGGGTRNALIRLGEETYLEIIGPDPDQSKPPRPRRFNIDELKAPRLVTWAVKGTDLDAIVHNAKGRGVDLGRVQSGSRKRPDGLLLSWRLTISPALTGDGLIPFFIDWGITAHPAVALPEGCSLVAVRAEHPDAKRVQAELSLLGVNLRVDSGSAPAIIATIRTSKGDVELR